MARAFCIFIPVASRPEQSFPGVPNGGVMLNDRTRTLAIFVVFAVVVHFVSVGLHFDRTWWVNAEPWVLLAVLWVMLMWQMIQKRRNNANSASPR